MSALFSPESKFMQIMSRVADLLLLNLCFLLTCAPIVTIGAASTALYTVCFRFRTDREQGVVGSYFRAFRENLKQGVTLWLIILLCGVSSAFNTCVFYLMPGAIRYAFVLFAILFILVVLISGYVFPLLSQFESRSKDLLRNALILSLGYLPRSLIIAALNLLPFILLLVNFYLFLQAAFIWVALYFSTAAYLNTFVFRKVFAPYMPQEDESIKEELP